MKHARIFFFTLLGCAAACSGYEGGGDVLVAGGVSNPDGGVTPTVDSGEPRLDAGSDARTDGSKVQASTVIAYYPLDGDGSDQSPAAKHLDLSVSNASFGQGRVGSAIFLTAAGNAAVRPQIDDALTFGSRDFTIQAWLIGGSTVAVAIGTYQFGTPSNAGWLLYAGQSSASFRTSDPRGQVTAQLPSSTDFRHVVVRRASGRLSLIVDGSTMATRDNDAPIEAAAPFAIQRQPGSSGDVLRVDDVVIWSRALSDTEINTQRTRGLSGQRPLLEN